MSRPLLTILIAAVMTALTASGSRAQQVTAKASLDSVYILMGKQTDLHIEVIGPLSDDGTVAAIDTMWRDIEIASMGEPVINDLGNGRKQLLQDITIQAFDSGMYAVPPIIYIQGRDTFVTNCPVLKVVPVDVDSLKTINDFADVQDIPRQFFDFVPDWMSDYGIWVLLALAVVGLALFVYFKWLRQGKIPLIPTKKPVPPYESAIASLEQLRDEHLCERGEEKQFYTRLTEILRVYLERRFGINAMEMTSTQIIKAVRDNEETRQSEEQMKKILEIADFVKFAKVRPLPDDNQLAFRSALKFVEDTKPVPVPEPSEETGEADADKAKS